MKSRFRVLAGAVAAVAVVAVLPTLASGAPSGDVVPPGATVDTVTIKMKHGLPKFVAPATVHQGDYLEIDNKTNPHQIGPHTFSLITKGSVPKTKHARKVCFSHKHICKAIAGWHGVTPNGGVQRNPAEAGLPGWDTMGSLHAKGDSWFTGEKPNTSFVQIVSADASTGPKTLYFQCAIHPFMHGKITVLAPGT